MRTGPRITVRRRRLTLAGQGTGPCASRGQHHGRGMRDPGQRALSGGYRHGAQRQDHRQLVAHSARVTRVGHLGQEVHEALTGGRPRREHPQPRTVRPVPGGG